MGGLPRHNISAIDTGIIFITNFQLGSPPLAQGCALVLHKYVKSLRCKLGRNHSTLQSLPFLNPQT